MGHPVRLVSFTCPVRGCDYHDSGYDDDEEYRARVEAHTHTHVKPLAQRVVDAVTLTPAMTKAEQMQAVNSLLRQIPRGGEAVLVLNVWEVRD